MKSLRMLARITGVLAFTAWSGLPVHANIMSVDPSNTNVIAGQTLSLNIRIADASDLYAWEFDLGFDPTVLSATSVTEGGFLVAGGSTLFILGTIDNLAGTISFTANSLQSATPGVDGDGILATIGFTALAAGTSDLNLFNIILLDSELADITIDQVGGGNVIVSADTSSAPEPGMLALLGIGLAGMCFAERGRPRRRRLIEDLPS